jgi:hypothetical protein
VHFNEREEEERFMRTPYHARWDILCLTLDNAAKKLSRVSHARSAPRRLSRPPLERMMKIHDDLRRSALVNCTRLADTLEVSRKTIVRDIAFMRDRLELPIEFDPRINAYRYTHPVNAFPAVHGDRGRADGAARRTARAAAVPRHPVSPATRALVRKTHRPGCGIGLGSRRPTS